MKAVDTDEKFDNRNSFVSPVIFRFWIKEKRRWQDKN
jgi:hypothetical protein